MLVSHSLSRTSLLSVRSSESKLFSSVSLFFVKFAEWLLRYVFNVNIPDKQHVFSKMDLENFIQQNKSHTEEDNSDMNKELFENALSLMALGGKHAHARHIMQSAARTA